MPSLSLAGSSSDSFGQGSGAPVITSSGTASGSALVWIVWAANRTGSGGQLRAYDPVPVNGHPVQRFSASIGTASNYSVPGVGAGKIFVGNREGKVLAFGSPVTPPLSGSALSFPATTIGTSRKATLTLTANEPVTVTGLESSSTQFALGSSTPGLPAKLSNGETISVPVTFTPTQTGLVGGTVTAATSAGQVQFAVSGTGQDAEAKLSSAPPVVSFQATPIGGEREESATFGNVGGQPLTIEEVQLPGAPFAVEGAPAKGQQIAPGKSITVVVKFAPTSAGMFDDALVLKTSGGEGEVGISGSAGAPGRLQIAPEALDFASVPTGSSLTKSFVVTNTGGTAVPITKSKPPIGGEFAAVGSLQEGTTIQAGESVTEQVAFAPTEAGPAEGEWLINGEDESGLHHVLFAGLGTSPGSPSPGSPGNGGSGSGTSTAFGPAPAQGVSGVRESAPARAVLARLARTALAASRHGAVAVRVLCPSSEQRCLGTVKLTARTRSGRLLALATGSFALAGGQARTLALRLTLRARALLGRTRLLKASAILSAHDSSGLAHTTSAPVTIRAAAAQPRHGA
jgi:iron transport multicopper oxidase